MYPHGHCCSDDIGDQADFQSIWPQSRRRPWKPRTLPARCASGGQDQDLQPGESIGGPVVSRRTTQVPTQSSIDRAIDTSLTSDPFTFEPALDDFPLPVLPDRPNARQASVPRRRNIPGRKGASGNWRLPPGQLPDTQGPFALPFPGGWDEVGDQLADSNLGVSEGHCAECARLRRLVIEASEQIRTQQSQFQTMMFVFGGIALVVLGILAYVVLRRPKHPAMIYWPPSAVGQGRFPMDFPPNDEQVEFDDWEDEPMYRRGADERNYQQQRRSQGRGRAGGRGRGRGRARGRAGRWPSPLTRTSPPPPPLPPPDWAASNQFYPPEGWWPQNPEGSF